jgi:hypothetical protein
MLDFLVAIVRFYSPHTIVQEFVMKFVCFWQKNELYSVKTIDLQWFEVISCCF